MKLARIYLLLLLPLAVQAQTITLGPITTLAYCVGDTMLVPYTASGTFASDNHFFVQLSDASGSFVSYTPIGSNAASGGIISVPLNGSGLHFRLRVASTDPYDTSAHNGSDIRVVGYPTVKPMGRRGSQDNDLAQQSRIWVSQLNRFDTDYRPLALLDEPIVFHDKYAAAGESFQWHFDQDATISSSTDSVPTISFLSEGIKTGSLTVMNSTGCSVTDSFNFRIVGCTPVIPPSTVTVTRDTSDIYAVSILVKAGALYRTDSFQHIYVEPGGAVQIAGRAVVYLESGSSAQFLDGGGGVVIGPTSITLPSNDIYDTLYCGSLSFDYSLLAAGVAVNSIFPSLHQSSNHLFARAAAESIDLKLLNILGEEVVAKRGMGEIDLDLNTLQNGVYFAVAQAGNQHEMRRVAVVH
ncbi:MAG: hypothetical protein Q8922_03610 [Bacteroidota bacterium]|nr:hypothetical protein [Bacteroidota bacterium]MDP4233379.1 hypothetical protein [Bacteroidota bacterium]MDP4242245.1 hypothetical protein [Bacteroidota bacterium]MDP4287001.1 hypothetical protein [Bacteroidota bacterium]